MYKFVRCQTHPKCPDLQGWYLVLKPGDIETLEELHRGVSAFYLQKFGLDPHLQKDMSDPGTGAYLKHPVRLIALWLETIERYLATGKTVIVNSRGGMLALSDMKVLSEMPSEKLIWPDNCDPDEVITISRWPKGYHFYLTSNKERIFVPSKYDTLEEARQTAEKYTDNILEKL